MSDTPFGGEVDLGLSDYDLKQICGSGQAQQALMVMLKRMKEEAMSQVMMATSLDMHQQAQAYTRVVRTLEKKLINTRKEMEEKATVVSPFRTK